MKPADKKNEQMKAAVRMYCHGFGDCFLLTFTKGGKKFRMLIDCGALTSNESLRSVVQDIRMQCGAKGKIDIVVQTHEHKDHISGFNLKDAKGNLVWDDIRVGQVWQAWTENPEHKLARELKAKANKKKKALHTAWKNYTNLIGKVDHVRRMQEEFKGKEYLAAEQRYAIAMEQLLEFNDVDAEEMSLAGQRASAMDYFLRRAARKDTEELVHKYLKPGDLMEEKESGIPDVRFYVLGPPEDYAKLRRMEDAHHEEMYFENNGMTENFFCAVEEKNNPDAQAQEISPFSEKYFLTEKEKSSVSSEQEDHVWNLKEKQEWRAIDIDWLHNSGILALQLDSYTNNTSLVLAIELVKENKVLLFPGDAQIGSWLSWTESKAGQPGMPALQWDVINKKIKQKVTVEDLLQRTTFYKVGHHASHNATAKKHGLEMMSTDLVAMIPVDAEIAKKQGKRGWQMPAPELYQKLIVKTKGRIIRADEGIIMNNKANPLPLSARLSPKEKQMFQDKIEIASQTIETPSGKKPLYIEYRVSG